MPMFYGGIKTKKINTTTNSSKISNEEFEAFITNNIVCDNNYKITSQVINSELNELTKLIFQHILHYTNIQIDGISLTNEITVSTIMKCLGTFRIWYLSKQNEERNNITKYIKHILLFINENINNYKVKIIDESYIELVCKVTLKIIQNQMNSDEILNYLQINEEYSKLYLFIYYYFRRNNVLNDLYRISTDNEIQLIDSFYISLFQYLYYYY